MIDDALVNYTDRVPAAILEVDPSALVTIGFLAPLRTLPPVPSSSARERTSSTFTPIETGGLTFSQTIQAYGIGGPTTKPVVMGEFGAPTFAYPSPAAALAALVEWQRDSCPYGIDGSPSGPGYQRAAGTSWNALERRWRDRAGARAEEPARSVRLTRGIRCAEPFETTAVLDPPRRLRSPVRARPCWSRNVPNSRKRKCGRDCGPENEQSIPDAVSPLWTYPLGSIVEVIEHRAKVLTKLLVSRQFA